MCVCVCVCARARLYLISLVHKIIFKAEFNNFELQFPSRSVAILKFEGSVYPNIYQELTREYLDA